MFISRKHIKQITITVLTLVVGYFIMIGYMVTQDDPVFANTTNHEISAKELNDLGFEQVYQSTQTFFTMRNNSKLAAQYFSHNSDLTVVVLHGILSSSYTNNRFSGLIREAANAEVYALDLRGHGASDGQPVDVDYVGQYVDDVADVVSKIKESKPNGKIIIAGHSMGGGISLRYAMKQGLPQVDGYLLFAPQLGDNSPTNSSPENNTSTNNTSTNKAPDSESIEPENTFMAIHITRLIGLALLNSLNITNWNDLPVFFFNVPAGTPVNKYTFRSSASMSPTDYKEGLQAIDKPLLVVVGEKDEAFNASAYKEAVLTYSSGDFLMVDGQTHNGIRHDEIAMNRVRDWVKSNDIFVSNIE